MQIPALSQSKQALLACPESYVEQVIRGSKSPDSEASVRGTNVHRFLSAYTNHLVDGRLKKDLGFFDFEIKKCPPDAREILEDLRDRFEIDPEAVFATEFYIALTDGFVYIPDGAPVPPTYEGTLDLITIDHSGTRATIDDYKSNFRAFEADTFQGKLYSLLIFELNPGIEEVRFRLQFVRWNRDKEVVYTRANVPELRAEVRKWREFQVSLHDAALKPKALPGGHCVYCPLLANGCPIEKNPYTDPAGQLKNVLYFRQALKRAEEAVRENADKTGPIYAVDGIGTEYSAEWAIQDQKHIGLDALPAILDWQKQKNDLLLPKLRISGLTSLLKAKKRAPLADQVANFTEIVSKSKFRIGKVKEMEEEDSEYGE